MMYLKCVVLGAAFVMAASSAMAQSALSATTVGTKVSRGGNTVGGTAGSAAAGGTSASTIGLGASATNRSGGFSTVGGAGSAAAINGKAVSNTKIRDNPQMLQAQSRARAWDGGTWSQSMTNTRVRQSGDVMSWTRSMAHEPGAKPVMSSIRVR